MSLAYTTYLLTTDPGFRQAFQTDPATAIAAWCPTLGVEEQRLLNDLQPALSLSPEGLWALLKGPICGHPGRWGCE